ncbi:hypothetical protein ACHAWT_005645 [Skeletonema menzelii]
MERRLADGVGHIPVPNQCLSQPPEPQKQQRKATFTRRSSVSNEPSSPTSYGTAVACQPQGTMNDIKQPAHVAPVAALSLARVCGPSRSKCGYCGGKRINVLELDDGHNTVLSIPKENNNSACANGSTQFTKSIDKIDAAKTSKSYGLLFDSLPYDIYEDLINHGWRRSGKHLYRPHNFESCCPALSIRLEASKFAPRTTPQNSKLADDLANSVLVGGSKSQRRVGRNLLRAFNVYNSKCLPSEDDSVNASNLANIQLDNSDVKKATKCVEHHHLKKKSRRFSPCRGTDQIVSVPAARETREFDRASLQEFERTEQQFLLKMAKHIYEELTKQAIATVNDQANNDSERIDNPKWAWWNDSESDNIPKWCTFKLVSQGALIKASTAACAAASGRSRGALDKLGLALAVIDRLKESSKTYLQRNKSSGIRRVTEVAVHEKSGHVHIILDVSGDILATAHTDTAKNISTQQPQKASDDKPDPIQEMISSYGKLDQQYNPDAKVSLNDKCVQRFLAVRSTPVYESSLQPEVHRLFCLYQSTTHGDFNPFADLDESSNSRDEVHEYNYYKQKNLPGFLDIDVAYRHLDENRRNRIKTSYVIFYKFLCETPVPTAAAEPNPFCPSHEDGYDIGIPFGTYHQLYRLSTSKDGFDGPLVAVGVLDVLPHCISSVYAFYDPVFSARLELGKYTALREIEWVRRASKYRTELKYYYLGYYIHSCRKMNYKAEYKPSELLCPVTSKWVDFETARKVLEERSPDRHCCALFDVPHSAEDETSDAANKQSFVDKMALDIGTTAEESQVVRVDMLNGQGRELVDPVVTEFVNEVGVDICSRFVLKLS